MTNEDALFFLTRFRTKGINEHLYEALGVAIEALLKKPKWTLCKDKLPGSVDVLCRDIRGDICIATPYEDEDSNTGYSAENELMFMIDCIEWMPLPETYRGEE